MIEQAGPPALKCRSPATAPCANRRPRPAPWSRPAPKSWFAASGSNALSSERGEIFPGIDSTTAAHCSARAGSEGKASLSATRSISLGARITLERDCRVAPFAITCGIYGWMMHTRFFSSQVRGRGRSTTAMKIALAMLLEVAAENCRRSTADGRF